MLCVIGLFLTTQYLNRLANGILLYPWISLHVLFSASWLYKNNNSVALHSWSVLLSLMSFFYMNSIVIASVSLEKKWEEGNKKAKLLRLLGQRVILVILVAIVTSQLGSVVRSLVYQIAEVEYEFSPVLKEFQAISNSVDISDISKRDLFIKEAIARYDQKKVNEFLVQDSGQLYPSDSGIFIKYVFNIPMDSGDPVEWRTAFELKILDSTGRQVDKLYLDKAIKVIQKDKLIKELERRHLMHVSNIEHLNNRPNELILFAFASFLQVTGFDLKAIQSADDNSDLWEVAFLWFSQIYIGVIIYTILTMKIEGDTLVDVGQN